MDHIISFKILILFALLRLLNCEMPIKKKYTKKSIIYDNEKRTGSEAHKSPTIFQDIVETKTEATEDVTDENNIRVVCPYFKYSGEINLELMVGVWRPAYYPVSHKVPCFKMLIRKVTSEESSQYSQLYGDFNEKVIWDDCHLEIKSSANLVTRRHFLQGCEKGFGVFENIIIEQKDDAVPSLFEEDADQWLVIKNLLLMRDCVSGNIVIFSREGYHQPKLNDVLDAMNNFGNISNGEWACNDGIKTGRTQAFDGEFDSDSDLVFFE